MFPTLFSPRFPQQLEGMSQNPRARASAGLPLSLCQVELWEKAPGPKVWCGVKRPLSGPLPFCRLNKMSINTLPFFFFEVAVPLQERDSQDRVPDRNKGNTPTNSLVSNKLQFSEKSLSQNSQGEVPEDCPSGEKM